MSNKPYDEGVIVKYDGAPYDCGCHYLVDIGFHNKIINLRTYAPQPRPLTMNGKLIVSRWAAVAMIDVIKEQFPSENSNYLVIENEPVID